MSEDIFVIRPKEISNILSLMIHSACGDINYMNLYECSELPDLTDKRLLFAVELNQAGYCLPIIEFISRLYEKGSSALKGSVAALLVHSPNDYNTKSAAADMIFQLNLLGCQFPGHPMVEAIGSLNNFRTWQKSLPMSLEEICQEQSARLGERLWTFQPPVTSSPYIVALHSSFSDNSNTLALWNMVKKKLGNCSIEELHVENGTIKDCRGCSFKSCLHYSRQSSCFYGGILVEEIYPAIEKADAVVWICPNYNDAVSANLSAVINRLTALYRKTSFKDKALYAIIVSGNSGSDSIAMQLLNSLCINKGFYLPAKFCITATANDPGAIHEVADIGQMAKDFANHILYAKK